MRPYILITNDDGIFSPGLLAAAEAVSDLGDLLICAPICQQTSMARSFPRTEGLGIIEKIPLLLHGKEITGYGIHGSPAYAVAHGCMEIAKRKPDLCISGINYGENLGLTLTCSGTIGAALEAHSHNIAAIAVSMEVDLAQQRSSAYSMVNWKIAKQITGTMAQKVLKEGMPEETSLFNINVPKKADNPEEYRYTKQSRQNYFIFKNPPKREWNKPFELASQVYVDCNTLEKDSDIQAVYIDHKISVTPITWNMTSPNFF